MLYAIQKNASGTVESVYAWTDDKQPIPVGCVACSEAEHTAAKNSLVNSLQAQAAAAESWIQTQALLAYAGEKVFTAAMNDYVAAIAAIANGTDTTSTVLPSRPTDVMASTAKP